ncbi:hypothetical protein CJ030_MR4G007968 [Morella rubra]|uniref:Uncharacterized protein n=1 Tax=Morella rubra TaxID=262757 RepID=A0A6A1VSD7_9ROSI|nr:hypothetical protein CJ030_MR4G007968 [Morella rubra]
MSGRNNTRYISGRMKWYNDKEEVQDYIVIIAASYIIFAASYATIAASTPRSFEDDEPLNNDETLDNTRVRKVRGGTRMTEVWNLKEGTRIPTQFNENGQPLDTEGGIFTQFTGCVARVPNQIPLDAVDWRRVPTAIKEDCWTIMTKRFTIPEGPLGDIVKHRFLKDLGEKWRNYKCSLKNKYFDEAFTPQYVKSNAPTDHRSQAGKQSRSLQTSVHAAGTKSFARHAHELEKEKQVIIDRAELYKAVHSRSDGSPMNPDVAEKIKRMEEIQMNELTISQPLSQSTMGGSISWSPSDRYAQVIGPERHGRIRGVGLDQLLHLILQTPAEYLLSLHPLIMRK